MRGACAGRVGGRGGGCGGNSLWRWRNGITFSLACDPGEAFPLPEIAARELQRKASWGITVCHYVLRGTGGLAAQCIT